MTPTRTTHPKGVNNPRGLKDIPFALPEVTKEQRAHALKIANALAKHYPDAHCELTFTNPHELLIATILSAQSTDAGVNKATPGLFKAFKNPAAYAKSTPEKIQPYIKTIGLFRNKSKSIHESMTRIVEHYDGNVPNTMEDLITLRGVARKTANVVLGNCFDVQDGITVDTHVQRLVWRWGILDEPKANTTLIEKTLMALFPRSRWSTLGHSMVIHGRYNCTARPNCTHEHQICTKFGVNCDKPYNKSKL
ncbi:MAG: endonuclease III [Phycisphaerales bacterium]|nr:endonuclease III [Phycisphaerales bacterium]